MRGAGPPLGFVSRPARGRRRLLALAAIAAIGVVGLRGAATSAADDAPRGAAHDTSDAATLAAGADPGGARPTEPPAAPTRPFAEIAGMRVAMPSADALLVGFHEASLPGALALSPVGMGRSNANTTRITLPPDRDEGVPYHVMSSRGRTLPPTSAADIVMRDDDPVLAPVDGVVTEVRPYQLYDTHPDTRIEIRPDDAPDLRLVLIHVADVRVAVGDHVDVGRTVLAGTANRFPFASHVDRYLDDRWPHVHLEVVDPSARQD